MRKFVYESLSDILKPKNINDIYDQVFKDPTIANITKILPLLSSNQKNEFIDKIDNNIVFTAGIKSLDGEIIIKSLKNATQHFLTNPTSAFTYFANYLLTNKAKIFGKDIIVLNNLAKKSCQLDIPYLLNYAIENGADVNFKDSFNSSPLYYAAKHQNFDCVKILIENGANVNEKNREGNTALLSLLAPATHTDSSATQKVNTNIFWYLIDNGANIYIRNDYNSSIYIAADNALLYEIIKMFGVENKDDLNFIIHSGTIKIFKYLLEIGIDKKILSNLLNYRDAYYEQKLKILNNYES